ncbi:Os01g0630000 [Oryza sativa Japonica Group]|uniref:Os01g0630000 protein n=1 Tax=Oryza sativa subsp. japonica TaxID=39947 RepID=A0A0P0V5L1_ORYSJ|nr:hypothetical protein EE612_004501 [Oryza sativa]BAS73288.1 Os01g0630000 [Oryza sativa Japonica Group]
MLLRYLLALISIIPEKLYPWMACPEDQSSNLIDGQHFYQEIKAFLSAPQQRCIQCSKCQWLVYTAILRIHRALEPCTILYFHEHTVQKIVVGVSLNATRASPKSQIFSLQLELANIFFGFRSRDSSLPV